MDPELPTGLLAAEHYFRICRIFRTVSRPMLGPAVPTWLGTDSGTPPIRNNRRKVGAAVRGGLTNLVLALFLLVLEHAAADTASTGICAI
jgi:hypothetical protein